MYSIKSILLEQLEITKGSNVAFWGASLFLKDFIKNNDLTSYNIVGIIDSDIEKRGNYFGKYQIVDYKKIINDIDYIIFTVKNNNNKVYNFVSTFLSEEKQVQKLLPNLFVESNVKKLSSNKIFLVNNGKRYQISGLPGLEIRWLGQNSIIEIGANPIPKFINFEIECADDCYISLGSTQYGLKNVVASFPVNGCELIIGKGCSIGQAFIISVEKNKTIKIGNDCMFSDGIVIRTSDAHSIFDVNTNVLLNKGGDVNIGDRVWVCQKVTLLKNTELQNDTIVGASSLVNKKFKESNIAIAGNPAKVVKRNIKWDRKSPDFFEK